MLLSRFHLLAPAVTLLLAASAGAQEPSLHLEQDGDTTRLVLSSGGTSQVIRTTTSGILDPGLVGAPGSQALGITWREADPDAAEPVPYQTVSLDGWRFAPPRPTSYELRLRYSDFDPLLGEPVLPPSLESRPGAGLWIVQFHTQGLEPWREMLRGLGVRVHLFLAWHANVVAMDAATARMVRDLPFVRWVGPYHPAYRLDEELLAAVLDPAADKAPRKVNVLTLRRGLEGQEPVAARIRELGGRVSALDPYTYRLRAVLTPGQIRALAHSDGVQFIDPWGEPEPDMNIARDFHGALTVEPFGYDGTGVSGEVLDVGTETSHPDFSNFLTHNSVFPASHGTATFGQVFGTGANNTSAKGTLYQGQGIVADTSSLGNRYQHTAELVDPNGPYRAVFQTNSWGSPRSFNYTSASQTMDLILFDHNLTICQSQSNAGNQDSRPQAWAKNIIAVGGIRHQNTLTTSDDTWNFGASIGPAADGRIKPDLASFYDNILTTDRVGGSGYSSGNYTSTFGGTSGATPIVAGMVGLFYAMWNNAEFGNTVNPGGDVFSNRPENTTAKAFMINTASQWSFTGQNHDLTRVHQGWGHPDVARLYNRRNEVFFVDESDLITELQTNSYQLMVPSGQNSLKATLVYRDNPGTVSSSQHRINDLTLRVVSPSGQTWWGNNGLAAGPWSVPGGAPNHVDTVENVFVQNPAAGEWRVDVIAHEINQDNHVETAALDADYALVVTGVTGTVNGFDLAAQTTGGGTADLTLTLSNIPAGTTEGYTLVTLDTTNPLGSGPLTGIWPDATTFVLAALPASAGNPAHWTWPVSSPLFPADSVSFGPGSLPWGAGTKVDFVGLAFGGGFTYLGQTPVRRVTF